MWSRAEKSAPTVRDNLTEGKLEYTNIHYASNVRVI